MTATIADMAEARFSYAARVRAMLRVFGPFGTITHLARAVFELARDSLPSRRRLRFGDLDYDWEQGVDTTWSNVGFATRVREVFAGRGYQATDPQIFREMMEQVPLDLRGFTFVDLGSGKGRALLLAREYPFARIVGVELLPELHEVARRNLARLPAEEQARFELTCGDAREFDFPAEPLFVHLFDPLPEAALAGVIHTLEKSMQAHPRAVFIGYQNPVSERVIALSTMFRKLGGNLQWALYRGVSS